MHFFLPFDIWYMIFPYKLHSIYTFCNIPHPLRLFESLIVPCVSANLSPHLPAAAAQNHTICFTSINLNEQGVKQSSLTTEELDTNNFCFQNQK